MNIFYLDHDPQRCAEYHVDKHVVKMILEYAQLLSTAHRVLDGNESIVKRNNRKQRIWQLDDGREGRLYKATHINHSSAVWVRLSKNNYIWLANMLNSLCKEYTYRYDKIHKVEQIGLSKMLVREIPQNIMIDKFTEPTTAMPEHCKIVNNSIASYRNYYKTEKKHIWNWKKREIPYWIKENIL